MLGNFLLVRMFPLGVAAGLPGVVDLDVDVANILHAARDHRIGHGAYVGIGDPAGKLIPTVPAHGRRSDEAIVGKIVQRRQGKRSWGGGCLFGRADRSTSDDLAFVAVPFELSLSSL
jgi:hypothetical protein